ncbi:TRAP transporter substrate-binding protein [Roseobacter sp. N2S]|uniref:TRAP transporter substrate-binding protein n=1 Tax=Roseobacter sp. N2S TaxID=2663844 RepID=UPI00285CBAEE|nr:TRAP transporter substrate-binding protein [Roseobacter sp. N2S]MDR6266885.1 C4-dicarboxylate-binding protein DctP [Roseobacter sp. N2S]
MNIKTITTAALLAGAAAIFTPSHATAQEYVLKVSAPIPPTEKDSVYAWMLAFEKGVEASSNGQIDVQLFPANQLGQLPAAVEGVSMGTIEVSFSIIGFFSSLDPRFQVLDAGGLFDSPEHAMQALQQPESRAMLAEFGKSAGVRPLVMVIDGQGVIVSKNPISTVADFKGLKVRTGGATPLLTKPLAAMGAAPIAMPLGEVVPGLQTGTIDAATNSMAVVNGFKMADVAKNVTYLPGNYTTVGAVVNTAFLERIGPDLAAIVLDEAQKAESVIFDHLAKTPMQEAAWEAAGGQVIRFNDAEQENYLSVTNPIVAEIISANLQMQSDFDVLKAAAAK